jgi:hypothetical protein
VRFNGDRQLPFSGAVIGVFKYAIAPPSEDRCSRR